MTDKLIDNSVTEQLAQLRNIYVGRLPAEFTALKELASGLDKSELVRGNLNELHGRLHKLSGSGGTFGLVTLSARDRIIEQQIKLLLAETFETLEPDLCKQLMSDILSLSSEAVS